MSEPRINAPLRSPLHGANASLPEMTAVLLVGGKGSRLRPVLPSTPKPLARVGDYSFLELLIRQLRHQGICKLVMCTGYLGSQIEDEFGDGQHLGVAIRYSKESTPLGTAGALKLAKHLLDDCTEFLVLNGDSFIKLDFGRLIKFHRQRAGLAALAVTPVDNAARYGTVKLNCDGRVISLMEKSGTSGPGLVNAGVYIFNQAILDYIEESPSSLERDVIPCILNCGVFALQEDGFFIDIGTPQDYALANAISHRLHSAAFDLETGH